jgi:hypothetical protein
MELAVLTQEANHLTTFAEICIVKGTGILGRRTQL